MEVGKAEMNKTKSSRRELDRVVSGFVIAVAILFLPGVCQAQGYTITTFAGKTGTPDFTGDGGPATGAKLNGPYGVALDLSGNLYIADYQNDVVRKIAINGVITTVAGSDSLGYSGDNGPATSAKLNGPEAVAVDTAGNLYIADTVNNAIRKVSINGTITTFAGRGSGCAQQTDLVGDGCPATSAKLSVPSGVAVDPAGNVYIGDTSNNRIRLVSPNGIITTAAGTGHSGYSGDEGPAAGAMLDGPTGLALNAAGELYIADPSNFVIRKISANGTITTMAGSNSQGYFGDGGAAVDAKLNLPSGVAADNSGNVYIADMMNSRVREVLANGVITTIAGNGACGAVNYVPTVLATDAKLCDQVAGVAVDPDGNVYVADYSLNRIFRLTPPSFFSGEDDVTSPIYYLQLAGGNLFGYYGYLSSSVLFHVDLGYEAFISSANDSIYFYDFASGHWWYSSASLFPYLYDFSLSSWIYYFTDPNNPGHYSTNPRYFSNLTTQMIFKM
jgi:sugar lactone lactonase YvrE